MSIFYTCPHYPRIHPLRLFVSNLVERPSFSVTLSHLQEVKPPLPSQTSWSPAGTNQGTSIDPFVLCKPGPQHSSARVRIEQRLILYTSDDCMRCPYFYLVIWTYMLHLSNPPPFSSFAIFINLPKPQSFSFSHPHPSHFLPSARTHLVNPHTTPSLLSSPITHPRAQPSVPNPSLGGRRPIIDTLP